MRHICFQPLGLRGPPLCSEPWVLVPPSVQQEGGFNARLSILDSRGGQTARKRMEDK